MQRMRDFFIILFLFVFAAGMAQQEPPKEQKIQFRLKFGSPKEGVLVNWDDRGIKVRIDEVIMPFLWEEIMDEDVAVLKARLFGEIPTPVKEGFGTVNGVIIRTTDGKLYEGIEIPDLSDPATIVIQPLRKSGKIVIKRSEILSRQEKAYELSQVFTADQIKQLMITKFAPKTSEDYMNLAEQFFKANLIPEGQQMAELSRILARTDTADSTVQTMLIGLRQKLMDLDFKKMVYEIQADAVSGELDSVAKKLEELYKHCTVKQAPSHVLDDIKNLKAVVYQLANSTKFDRIVSEFYLGAEALALTKAIDRTITYAAALDYLNRKMLDEVYDRISSRVKLVKGDPYIAQVVAKRPQTILRKHSYDEASTLRMGLASDPESFWQTCSNEVRYKFLLGMFIEKFMEVTAEAEKSCPDCGGKGRLEYEPVRTCDKCVGTGKIRIITYR